MIYSLINHCSLPSDATQYWIIVKGCNLANPKRCILLLFHLERYIFERSTFVSFCVTKKFVEDCIFCLIHIVLHVLLEIQEGSLFEVSWIIKICILQGFTSLNVTIKSQLQIYSCDKCNILLLNLILGWC